MIYSDYQKNKEIFSELFLMSVQNKMNMNSFTSNLERSKFVNFIENDAYNEETNKSVNDIFFEMTGFKVNKEEHYGIYNDAYWCGFVYFDLFFKTQKPFSYIFLKLPFSKLIDLYKVYHEMDFSSLLDLFKKYEKENTILRLLCKKNKISLTKLSELSDIPKATLSLYNSSDDALYKASFQNIVSIAKVFDAPLNLFIKHININVE